MTPKHFYSGQMVGYLGAELPLVGLTGAVLRSSGGSALVRWFRAGNDPFDREVPLYRLMPYPLNLVVGKAYRTRLGERVVITARSFVVPHYTGQFACGALRGYYPDGSHVMNDRDYDLVGLWFDDVPAPASAPGAAPAVLAPAPYSDAFPFIVGQRVAMKSQAHDIDVGEEGIVIGHTSDGLPRVQFGPRTVICRDGLLQAIPPKMIGGGYYRRRDGGKEGPISGYDGRLGRVLFPWACRHAEGFERGVLRSWNDQGRMHMTDLMPGDLVAHWIEPEPVAEQPAAAEPAITVGMRVYTKAEYPGAKKGKGGVVQAVFSGGTVMVNWGSWTSTVSASILTPVAPVEIPTLPPGPRVISITADPEGGLDVLVDGLSSGGRLTVGEVLEQVLALIPAEHKQKISSSKPAYRMETPETWAAGRKGRNHA